MCSEFETFLEHINLMAEHEAQDRKISQLEDRIAQLEQLISPGVMYEPKKKAVLHQMD